MFQITLISFTRLKYLQQKLLKMPEVLKEYHSITQEQFANAIPHHALFVRTKPLLGSVLCMMALQDQQLTCHP